MKKLISIALLVMIASGSSFAAQVTKQAPIDTTKKIRSIKPMRMRKDTMVKKPMKKDTTKNVISINKNNYWLISLV